ncbi:MAG TPA: LysM peptidoglycan-binding domain-containing protein [Chloroflexi bacterium]|nr:LysM peptidoglycan-binding domain-containing protein [Chloroflexota bacterium]
MTRMHTRIARRLRNGAQRCGFATVLLLAFWLSLACLATPRVFAQTATPVAAATYIVQPGDSWTSVARKTGLSIRELQAANPGSVRASGWLIVGEELVIPNAAPAATATTAPVRTPVATAAPAATSTQQPTGAQQYTVQPGESWNSIAAKFGVDAEALRAANPQAVRPGLVLFRGDVLTIPGKVAAENASSTATPAATMTAVAPTTETMTAAPTEEAASEPTTAAAEETATEAATAPPACPEPFTAYPAQLAAQASASAAMEDILDLLRTCEALSEANVRSGDWNGDSIDDWVVVLQNPHSDAATPETELLIFMSEGDALTLSYQARPAGQVTMLAADDINVDGKPDLAWVDTTCGASTCFDTVIVRSWDGATWADWTDSTIVMAYAEVKLADARDTAQGSEIVLTGGEYGSVGAGPQRARTEVWGSVEGAPYRLLDKVYERSNCLYFKVLDAGEALARYQEIGLVQAREMYTEAVTNRNLVKCGARATELEELRSFSLFRLALIYAYEGETALAAESVAQLQSAYPDSPFTGVAETWLAAYEAKGDLAAACAAVTAYAETTPAAVEALSDYGYANPTFTAVDLCPVLDIEPTATPATAEATATPEVIATTPITPLLTLTATADASTLLPAAPATAGELPDCPTTLDGYATSLPAIVAAAEADPLVVETWLRLCDGMADDRGGMLLADFNADGIEDAIFLPTIVSDLGFGPGGAQGAVLIYHGDGNGGYRLVDAPEIYGQPTLLAADDVNGDGRIDLAWTVEGCSTFCVKEVQIVTWDADKRDYIPIIEPGAIIAEGAATFTDLPEGAPGQGKQLLLTGGVSGAADGGLEIEHTEAWQSVDGRPFRRLSWTYDPENANSTCVGLRLIEADAALHAADLIGYARAIELYRSALNPALKACSIYGVPAPEELKLLQGLATYRLIQAQALAGDREAANADLAALQQGQPNSAFANAAAQWLESYTTRQDAGAACRAVQPIFDKETLTWQITDHFGYNHPALAPEQVCFVPRNK